jgi:thermitase
MGERKMRGMILSMLMSMLILTTVLTLPFMSSLSLAEGSRNDGRYGESVEGTSGVASSNETFIKEGTNGTDVDWQGISKNSLVSNGQQNWDFNNTDGWRDSAYSVGDRTRLIVGIGSSGFNAGALEQIAARHQGEIVNTVSIKGEAEAAVVELPLVSVESFVSETIDSRLASYVEPDMKVQAEMVPNDPSWGVQWGPQKVQADWAWNTTVGNSSVLVAVVDSGIDSTHPDLAANYAPLGFDWVNNDTDPKDDLGHGTHCAGIIAAVMNNGIGVAGLAQVRVMAEKVIDNTGSGTADTVANGIIHAVEQGAKIISLSLGDTFDSELVHDAVKYAYAAGVLVIASAGNDNTNAKLYPAAYDEVIAVAATDQHDLKAGFSNWGDWIELTAPGVDIYSTMPTYRVYMNGYGYSMNYDFLSGTSMACPHVSGTAALLWSRYPTKSRDWVRLWLRYTSNDLGDPGFDTYYGYGRINAREALERSATHELIVDELRTLPYVKPGTTGIANATILNLGETDETNVAVKLLVNNSVVDYVVISSVPSSSSATASLSWHPTVVGWYNITVYVEPVLGETSVENNALSEHVYVGVPVKAVVLYSAGNILSEAVANWQTLNVQWQLFGTTAVYIDYETLNKENITYADISATEADVLIISCAYDESRGWEFTDSEIAVIETYVYQGHGLIATAGTFDSEVPNNNKLLPLFGMNQDVTWGYAETDLLHVLNSTHPLFTGVPNPLVFPSVGSNLPSDGPWDSKELTGGEYLALGHFNESAIVTFRGLIYVSPWLEIIPPYYRHHLQLFYNAIIWSRYQKPQHDLAVLLDTPHTLQPGESTLLRATVSNIGLNSETNADLYLMLDGSTVKSTVIQLIPVGSSFQIQYNWFPSAGKTYNITAYSPPMLGDECKFNNVATSIVTVNYYKRTYAPHDWVGSGVPMGWHADDRSWQYNLTFNFPFYGVIYKTIYISSNGLIAFRGPDTSYRNSISELAQKIAIAPAWDDWKTSSPYDIYIWQNSTCIGIRWCTSSYGSNIEFNFEALLNSEGVIQFNYGHCYGTASATTGISNGTRQAIAEDLSDLNYTQTIIFTPSTSYPAPASLTITSTTGGTTNPADGTYTIGTTVVVVTATPAKEYYFDSWQLDGVDAGFDNSITVNMDANHTLHAVFTLINPGHDVTIRKINTSKTVVGEGYNLTITVISMNIGNFTEVSSVTLNASATCMGQKTVTLDRTVPTTVTLACNTSALAYGNYTICAHVAPVAGEVNTTNNDCVDGLITVTIPGDVDGNFAVRLADLVLLAQTYGSKPSNSNWNPNVDIDGNNVVGLSDIVILAQHYGQHYP